MPAIGIAISLVTEDCTGGTGGLNPNAITDETVQAITDESGNAITDQ